ncbi:MAG: cobalamin B12-binding domain-containing protein [Candidatus Thorarchaeota archaeon]|nr:MAG: cobalamin-binding protein [Candidatus Thorarchaeota archaeon]RLI59490.1 MAG: cobalamin-binding protein [Candidatus Thorarchaeota archaeon]
MNPLTKAMADLEDDVVMEILQRQLKDNRDPFAILQDLKDGMDIVGDLFSKGEYFLVELVMSADIFKRAMQILEPLLLEGMKGESKGKVVIGTVQGDVHYLGKSLVVAFLKCNGYEVYDLGEDVAPEKFVEELKRTGAPVLALSGLITTTHDVMRSTIDALKEGGLRDRVRVIIGGGDIDETIVEYTGADAFGKDAMSAVDLVGQFI